MPTAAISSSGDLMADRRFVYAEASAAEGDDEAAAELLAQCLELAPDWPAAWFALGAAKERLGDVAASIDAYRGAFERDPQDVLGARLALARLGAAETPATAAPAYVARLFDQYAPRFEAHLVEGLGYRAPALLREAILGVCGQMRRQMHFARALDLGCGTGLAGEAFCDCVDQLEGVDLSAGMVLQARAKGIYAALHVRDAVSHLKAASDRQFDLIVAADVLVYVGDLAPLFIEVARVLTQDGLFAFTAESHGGEGYVVSRETRYAHSRSYIERAASDAGLALPLMQSASTRNNKGAAIQGLIAVMTR